MPGSPDRASESRRVSMICLIPALAQAQDAPDAAPDQIIHVNTRIRHTTVISFFG